MNVELDTAQLEHIARTGDGRLIYRSHGGLVSMGVRSTPPPPNLLH